MSIKKRGKIVKTKSGKFGQINNGEKLIKDKIPVYLTDKKGSRTGIKIMCDPETLEHKGYFD